MRKMFTVGLAAVMAMGLCACGSQKAAETTAAPAAAETTAAPSQDEKKEEAEETTEAQASSETAGGEGCGGPVQLFHRKLMEGPDGTGVCG